jgi:hypothetical protein
MSSITQEEINQEKNNELNRKILRDKERLWLKQFNDNFKKYKDIVKQASYERDSSMLDDLSRDSTIKANRKFIYNNFPLILGIIFVIFGLIIFFLSSEDKPQVVPPQINPVFIKMPTQSPTQPADIPPEFFSALAQSGQQTSGQPISIPINVTTGATTKGNGKSKSPPKSPPKSQPTKPNEDYSLLFKKL